MFDPKEIKLIITVLMVLGAIVLVGSTMFLIERKRGVRKPRDRSGLRKSLRRRRYGRRRRRNGDEYDESDDGFDDRLTA